MLRRLHTFLALFSILLLAVVIVLWVRSHRQADTFTLRTALSYSGWPAAKWVVVRSRDGLILSVHLKVVPSVEPGNPPWREDVPAGYVVPVSDSADPAILKRIQPPTAPAGRLMTALEHRGYESRIAPLYAAVARFQWQARPPGAAASPPADSNAALRFLSIWTYHGDQNYFVDEDTHPGAYRDVGVRAPFAIVAVAAAILPASWLPLWLRRRAVHRRRLLAGHCPRCGYDLRGSPGQCPECGWTVSPAEPEAARLGFVRLLAADLRRARPRRRTVAVAAIATCGVAVSLFLLFRHSPPRAAARVREVTVLRRELDRQLDTVAREVERLRRAGDAAGADRLDAELGVLRRRAGGAPAESGDEPELHMVGVYGGRDGQPANITVFNPRTSDTPGVAAVAVTAKDRPVVLALCAYAPMKWDLRLAPGVRLQRVLLGGSHAQQVAGLPPGVPVTNLSGSGANMMISFFAYQRDSANFATAQMNLRRLTRLSVKTFQGSYQPDDEPFVVGPPNPAWETQRILTDLRPLYLRATRVEKSRAREEFQSVRFRALWTKADDRPGPPATASLAEFDVTGPIQSTLQPLATRITGAALDPVSGTWYAVGGNVQQPGFIDAKAKRFVAFKANASAPKGMPVAGIAFDPGRRRLMLLHQHPNSGADCYLYTPDDGKRVARRPLATFAGYESLTWSDADDCYYALGQSYDHGGRPQAITRISSDGVAEWRIPVPERLMDNVRRGPSFPPQIAAAGPYLALLTAPLPDPDDPDAPERQRCVLIDPKTMAVIYSGPVAPHEPPAASSAPTTTR